MSKGEVLSSWIGAGRVLGPASSGPGRPLEDALPLIPEFPLGPDSELARLFRNMFRMVGLMLDDEGDEDGSGRRTWNDGSPGPYSECII